MRSVLTLQETAPHVTSVWGMLLLIVVAVGVLAVALSNPHARRILFAIVGIGALLAFVLIGSWSRIAHKPAEMAANRMPTPDEEGIPIGEAGIAITKPATNEKEPEWVHDKAARHGDAYYVVISSGELADPSLLKVNLDVKMAAAAERYVRDVLGEVDMAEKLNFNATYIRDRCIAAEYEATDSSRSETFVRLKFDRQFDNEVKRRYREYLAISRVEKLGGATLGVLGVLAAALALLRFTEPRDKGMKRDG